MHNHRFARLGSEKGGTGSEGQGREKGGIGKREVRERGVRRKEADHLGDVEEESCRDECDVVAGVEAVPGGAEEED